MINMLNRAMTAPTGTCSLRNGMYYKESELHGKENKTGYRQA